MHKSLDILRDRSAGAAAFRAASREVCASLVSEMKSLLEKRHVATERVIFVIILRSGFALLDSALDAFPESPVGVLGMKRDEETLVPHWYYENLPPLSRESVIVILDPMLATGGSAEAAVTRLIEKGAAPEHIYFVGVIAAPEGVERLARIVPRENMILAAVDEKLDEQGMIVPGLGDFGDRYFGYGN